MIYFVYIVKCKDKTLYCGYTTNLERRVLEHNSLKKGAGYTKSRRPVKLIYSETYSTLSEALKREYQIKQLSREKKMALINESKKVLKS